jgi:Arc/MetJ-type ribon-helix-helix transcriptional regulator
MRDWATISLREGLIKEVRELLKTGRYRSVSEFVSEAIRFRLEEISRSKGPATPKRNSPTITAPSRTGHVETHPDIVVDRLEQVWLVLNRLFGDMMQKRLDVDINIVPELRNCRTLINFIRAHTCPGCDRDTAQYKLQDLQHSLEKVKGNLVAAALKVSEKYAKKWVNLLDEAERADLQIITSPMYTFVPDLPKDPETDWVRLTLSKPIIKEKAQEISKQFGVTTEFIGDSQLVVRGDKNSVKNAVRVLYQLQS